jgi:two-component system response regulator FixJ
MIAHKRASIAQEKRQSPDVTSGARELVLFVDSSGAPSPIERVVRAARGGPMVQEYGSGGEIFIVDDEPLICEALSAIFRREGFGVATFYDGDSFLAAARRHTPACILLDLNLRGTSGLDLLAALNAPSYPAPIFVISGQNDIPTAIDAVRRGARDFISKPFEARNVVQRVRDSLAQQRQQQQPSDYAARPRVPPAFPGHHLLTPRETQVLMQIANGASNKETGRLLGISPRTVEVHRARIMDKLRAKNAADLVRIVLSERR